MEQVSAGSDMYDGYLDIIISIFKARQHRVVLVEECAQRWMGLRVFPREDFDLLIGEAEMESIKADLLATGQFELVEQNLNLRFSDTYAEQVPRMRLRTSEGAFGSSVSLWSESVYMLSVDGEKIEVPDTFALNSVLIEERFELDPSWAKVDPISRTAMEARGVRILPHNPAQSPSMKYPVYIPTIPRMLNALLDQLQCRITYAKKFPGRLGNQPIYHLKNSVRYLHLEKPQQQTRVFPELAERNREDMKAICVKFKRKPLIKLADL
ncbi:MAG: hypothetical protein M1829_002560 [Trizodia sp. TS-e1964]|nr:MAG: hypothetical protein M1829_002560 [Trizodia sp. TS-e1964]